LAGGDPAEQLAGVVGNISTLSGVKVHDAWFGSPEQESVTNMGAVSAALFSGVTVTSSVPAWPGVSIIGNVAGAIGVRVSWKLGAELAVPCVSLTAELEAWCVASPV
jgi:hypothetical protein